MQYKVGMKKTEEGYSIWVPGLLGCWSQRKTEYEALENIKDAIHSYLEVQDLLIKEKLIDTKYVEVS